LTASRGTTGCVATGGGLVDGSAGLTTLADTEWNWSSTGAGGIDWAYVTTVVDGDVLVAVRSLDLTDVMGRKAERAAARSGALLRAATVDGGGFGGTLVRGFGGALPDRREGFGCSVGGGAWSGPLDSLTFAASIWPRFTSS